MLCAATTSQAEKHAASGIGLARSLLGLYDHAVPTRCPPSRDGSRTGRGATGDTVRPRHGLSGRAANELQLVFQLQHVGVNPKVAWSQGSSGLGSGTLG